MMLDLINAIMGGVNGLAKQFGTLNVVIGAITGFALQKNGLGKSRRVKCPISQDIIICHYITRDLAVR